MRILFCSALLVLLQACGGTGSSSQTPPKPLSPAEQTGIARFHGQMDCTAFLLDLGNDSAPAYALSNGHCAQNFSDPETPYAVIREQAADHRLVFFYAESLQDSQKTVQVTEITYSTMNQTDLSILKLNASVGELRAQGIQPIKIQDKPLPEGRAIEVLGAPITQFVRKVSCKQGPRVDVTESVWVWSKLQSNDCAEIYSGMSGSPVFNPSNGKAVGVISTTTVGMPDTTNCYLGTPCEIRSDGTRPFAKTSYAVPIDTVAACFVQGKWSPDTGLCPLQLTSGPALVPAALFSPMQHKNTTTRWQFEGASNTNTQIRFITAGQGQCATATDYQPYAAENMPFLPTQEGMYLACFREINAQGIGQNLTVHPIQIDNTPPRMAPLLEIDPFEPFGESGANRRIAPQFVPPEISGYEIGTADSESACLSLNDSDFEPYYRVPLLLKAPLYLCIKLNDRAGNYSPVHTVRIP